MSEDIIIRHCAPTLAGLKTGNIFTAVYDTKEELYRDISRMNSILAGKGIRVVVLRARRSHALIYVYRPQRLAEDLSRTEAREILSRYGYGKNITDEICLERLTRKIRRSPEFPHEIGLFLGYPPEDVQGFIKYNGRESKACGCWKVYGDVTAAEKQFRKFRKCTSMYMKYLEQGMPFEQMAVQTL